MDNEYERRKINNIGRICAVKCLVKWNNENFYERFFLNAEKHFIGIHRRQLFTQDIHFIPSIYANQVGGSLKSNIYLLFQSNWIEYLNSESN